MAARTRIVPLLLAILLAAACAADTNVAVEVVTPTPDGEPAEETPTEAPVPTEEPTAGEEPEPEPEPTVTPEPEPDPEPTATSEPQIPGEPFDFLVPADGEVVGVVGVAFDDILELHELPGENTPLIGELPNLTDDAVGTGEGRELPASIWWKIRWNGLEGWVGSGFMARIGATVDFTNDLIQLNGNSDPGGAETMLEFGLLIADIVASEEPPSRVVVVVPPDTTSGDLGEITVDVVNIGDDALKGYRLHIFAQPAEIADAGWLLKSVEATLLCSRGVTEDGFCV